MTQPTSRNRFFIQLYKMGPGGMPGEMISATGGKVYVAVNGAVQKASITDLGGSALTNPRSLTSGGCEFYCTSDTVDLYIQAPKGHWVVKKNVKAGGAIDIAVDVSVRQQVYVVPCALVDTAANTETDTGFDMPAKSEVGPFTAVDVDTLEAAKTIKAGLLSSESGGAADGWINGVSLATAVLVKATLANAGDTAGTALRVQDSANAGDKAPEPQVVTGAAAVSIAYTFSAATTVAKAKLILPVTLCGDVE